MYGTVKNINLLNNKKEKTKISNWTLHKSGKYYVESITTEPAYYCKEGDSVGILGKHEYVGYKEGCFYTVINNKDEVFFLDEHNLVLDCDIFVFIYDSIPTRTIQPKYIDCEDFNFGL